MMKRSKDSRRLLTPTIMYGTAWKEDRTEGLVRLALEVGYRAFDTANQRRHYLEGGVGAAVKSAIEEGRVSRENLFLQTKYTYVRGQDHRLPYDARADVATQVRQSMASSLEHLHTDHVDSYVLHGPASPYEWSPQDEEAWNVMAELKAQGKTRFLEVSNVGVHHLEQLFSRHQDTPAFVQNRCFAHTGWDREVRAFCQERGMIYQGFSLLTANPFVVGGEGVQRIAKRLSVTPAQVVLRFSQQVGMLPLTGTTSEEHMRQDLECSSFDLTAGEVSMLEEIAG